MRIIFIEERKKNLIICNILYIYKLVKSGLVYPVQWNEWEDRVNDVDTYAWTSHYNIDQSNWVYYTHILISLLIKVLFFSRSLNVLSAYLISYLYRLDSSFTLAIRRENEVKKKKERFDDGQVFLSFSLLCI